jgi:hypothetical protein
MSIIKLQQFGGRKLEVGEKRKFRSYKEYTKSMLKFYSLKNESFGQILFVLMAFFSIVIEFMPGSDDKFFTWMWFLNKIVNTVIIFFLSYVYISGYQSDLKGEKYTLKGSIKIIYKKIVKLFKAEIIMFMPTAILYIGGTLMFKRFLNYIIFSDVQNQIKISPDYSNINIDQSLILSVVYTFIGSIVILLFWSFSLFVYKNIIIDQEVGAIKAFKTSFRLIKGNIIRLIVLYLIQLGIGMLFYFIILNIAELFSDNILTVQVIMTFFNVVWLIISLRLSCLVYTDLTKNKDTELEVLEL